MEQLSYSAFTFADGPFAATAKDAAADYVRQAHVTFGAVSKMVTGSISEGQKLMSDQQRRGEAVLRRISENARTNVDAAFDACTAAMRARSVPEVVQLHTQFIQEQFAAFVQQSQDLVALAFSAARPSGRNGGERKDY